MKNNFTLLVVLIFLGWVQILSANNVVVTNVTLTNQNTSAGVNNAANHTFIRFNITWDNSWRVTTGPNNWDAVWVFAKYQTFGGNYAHATLSTNSAHHTVTTNNGVSVIIQPSADGRGVFMYRSSPGTGSINWQDVLLRWNYRTDGVDDDASVTMQVFAVEMVYIPQGSFYLGDGNINTNPSSNSFRRNNQPLTTAQGREAYLVTSENAITTLSGTSTLLNSLYDPAFSTSMTGNAGYTIPANYPKGFNAYYVMKYEISQKQYADFFNTLPTTPIADPQKGNRNITQAQSSSARNNFNWSGANLDDVALNRFGTAGSGDRAQNFLSWQDAIAYADWAALRPMSEFEFEKAARGNDVTYGPIYPINGEYAWGNTSINSWTGGNALNDNTISEGLVNPATNQTNAHYGSVTVGTVSGNTTGPVRCGIFAAKNITTNQRRQAGASFYGVMEMSGNVAEMVVAPIALNTSTCYSPLLSYPSGLSSAIHGNGAIPSGNCDVSSWTVISGGSYPVLRGGSWSDAAGNLVVSNRYGTYTYNNCSTTITNPLNTTRNNNVGFRPVRTAP